MRITFVTMATVMVCLIGVHGDVQPQRDFDLQRVRPDSNQIKVDLLHTQSAMLKQFAGKWYRVGLAYDSPGFTAPYRDKLRVSMGILNPQTNGNVNLTMWTQRSSGCRSKLYMYEKTAIPGAFTYFSTRHNKVKDITVVETNYNEYALVLKHKKMDREYTQVALYGRSQKVKTEVIQKFRDFATSHGFPKDAILTPPSAENCPPSGR